MYCCSLGGSTLSHSGVRPMAARSPNRHLVTSTADRSRCTDGQPSSSEQRRETAAVPSDRQSLAARRRPHAVSARQSPALLAVRDWREVEVWTTAGNQRLRHGRRFSVASRRRQTSDGCLAIFCCVRVRRNWITLCAQKLCRNGVHHISSPFWTVYNSSQLAVIAIKMQMIRADESNFDNGLQNTVRLRPTCLRC